MFGCSQTWGCHMHNRNHSFPSNPFGDNNGRNVESTEFTLHWFVYLTPYFSSLSNQINTAGLMGKTWREGINRFSGAQKVPLFQIEMARELSWAELRSFALFVIQREQRRRNAWVRHSSFPYSANRLLWPVYNLLTSHPQKCNSNSPTYLSPKMS